MTKLYEILEKKVAGKWWSIGDVILKELTITEDINPETTDIREDEKKQYFCIQVTDGKEIKDIHLAKGALRALAAVMPAKGTWKGKRFQIAGISGKGFAQKTHISLLTGDYDQKPEQQKRIGDVPIQSPNQIPVDPMAAAVTDVINAMRAGVGVDDSRLNDFVKQVCIDKMHIVQLPDLINILKYGGRIRNENGVWKVVVS